MPCREASYEPRDQGISIKLTLVFRFPEDEEIKSLNFLLFYFF